LVQEAKWYRIHDLPLAVALSTAEIERMLAP
jgi:hypothetical protein